MYKFLVLLLLSLFFLSCSKAKPTSSENEFRVNRLKIYFIPKKIGNPYFDSISRGFYDAIIELGEINFDYRYIGPKKEEPQSDFVREAILDKADAIFIYPDNDDALKELLVQAHTIGIRVYFVDNDILGYENFRDAVIRPVDFNRLEEEQLELMAHLMGYYGEFAMLSTKANSPDQLESIAYVIDQLAENPTYQSMRLVSVRYCGSDPKIIENNVKNLVDSYPNLKGILASTPITLPPAAATLKEIGAAGRIRLTGLALPSEMADFVKDFTVEEFQLWNPQHTGYLGVYLIWAEKRRGFLPVPEAAFNAGKLGVKKVTENRYIYAAPLPIFFDRTNIDRYAIQF